MWSAMREWLKTAAITEDRRLKDDLTGAKSLFTSSGAIQLESKKDMRSRGLASPDSADALCMTFAFPIAHREYVQKVAHKTYSDRNSASSGWMSH
jgi:hypothetical protein